MGGHMELVKNNVYLRNKAGQAANKMYVNEDQRFFRKFTIL